MARITEQIRRPVLPDVDSAMAREPWLWVRLGESGPEASGMTSACLGQVDLSASIQTGRDVYAQWVWNGKEAVVRNCRLVFFPLYYYATDKEFGVSPSIERLLAQGASAELDDAAMAVYLRPGWTLGEDTVFRHIRAIPPGGSVVLLLEAGPHVSAMQPMSIARRAGVMAVTPFLDQDLLDFRLSLPPEINVDKAFHDAAIRLSYPAFGGFPYADGTSIPPVEDNIHYRRFFLEAAAYLASHGTGELVQRGKLIQRLLALAYSSGNLRMRMRWIAPYTAIYLIQIESLLARHDKAHRDLRR